MSLCWLLCIWTVWLQSLKLDGRWMSRWMDANVRPREKQCDSVRSRPPGLTQEMSRLRGDGNDGSSLISARCRRPKSSDKNWWKCKCEMEVRGMRLSFRWFLNGRKSPLCNDPSFTNERTPSDNETSAAVKQRDQFGTHHSLFTLDFSLFFACATFVLWTWD